MISETLKIKFQYLEMLAFEEWKKSSKKERNKICKKLGEYEGREIIKEIEFQANQLKN